MFNWRYKFPLQVAIFCLLPQCRTREETSLVTPVFESKFIHTETCPYWHGIIHHVSETHTTLYHTKLYEFHEKTYDHKTVAHSRAYKEAWLQFGQSRNSAASTRGVMLTAGPSAWSTGWLIKRYPIENSNKNFDIRNLRNTNSYIHDHSTEHIIPVISAQIKTIKAVSCIIYAALFFVTVFPYGNPKERIYWINYI